MYIIPSFYYLPMLSFIILYPSDNDQRVREVKTVVYYKGLRDFYFTFCPFIQSCGCKKSAK